MKRREFEKAPLIETKKIGERIERRKEGELLCGGGFQTEHPFLFVLK